jgi:PAS domain S-box-containing protein
MNTKEKILVVDDEPVNQQIFSKIFVEAGYRVQVADNTRETFAVLECDRPDLVLLDIMLGAESGLDILKKMKLDPRFQSIYVVMISGIMKSSDDQATGLELGADGYLTRPITGRELVARIDAFMRHKRSIDSLIKSEQRFRKIIERNPDAILIVDQEGYIKFANPAAETLFNLTIDQLQSRLFGYPVVEGEHAEIDIFRHSDEPAVGEMRTIDIEWDDKVSFLTSIRNVTEHKKAQLALQENEENLRATLDSIGDAVISIDLNGNIRRMNPVAAKLTGWDVQEASGKALSDVYRIFDSHTMEQLPNPIHHLLSDRESVPSNQTVLISKDGTRYQIADLGGPIRDPHGNVAGAVLVFRDVTKEFEMQARVAASEARYRNLFEQAGDGLLIHNPKGKIVAVNQAFCRLFGYAQVEIAGQHVSVIHPPRREAAEIDRHTFERPLQDGYTQFGTDFVTKTGDLLYGEVTSSLVEVDGEKLYYSVFRDSTRRKQAEERIVHLNRVLHAILNVNQLITKERSRDQLLKSVCDRLIETGGYLSASVALFDAHGNVAKFTHSGLVPDTAALVRRIGAPGTINCVRKALAQPGIHTFHADSGEYDFCCLAVVPDVGKALAIRLEYAGTVYGVLTVSLPPDVVLDEEEYTLFGEVASDIAFGLHTIEMENERDRAKIALEASLQEKIELIRELYHRTKNNMQVIISMLRIQAELTDNDQVKTTLWDTTNRIQSMALVHEKLYQSQKLSHINLDEYIRDLAQLLLSSYHVAANKIDITFDLERMPALVDTAVPCGLVLNEFVSNALKHAFPGERSGEIRITLQRVNEKDVSLVVADNGIGVPQDFDFSTNQTFGMQIIAAIVEHQLQGKISFKSENGLTCQALFPDDQYRERV